MTPEEKLDTFLKQEEEKIAEADMLLEQIKGLRFGLFNPRSWKVLSRYSKVVRSFKICDSHYNINLPKV